MMLLPFLFSLVLATDISNLSDAAKHEYSLGSCSDSLNCQVPFGFCLDSNTCLCLPEYADLFVPNYSLYNLKCSYKKRRAVTAALLEIVLPFGTGHFYSQRNGYGFFKLALFFSIVIYMLYLYYSPVENRKLSRFFVSTLLFCLLLPLINVVELIFFVTGVFTDGHGIVLV